MRLLSSVLLFVSALVALPAIAGGAPDSRVRTALDAMATSIPATFEVDGDGDFKLLVQLDGGRTNIVWINSATETWDNMNQDATDDIEIREVWAPAFPSKGKSLSSKDANMLLLDSQQKKLGAWQAYPQTKGVYAVFNVKIGAESDASSLASVVRYVARAADQMEIKMTKGRDAY